MGTLQGVTATRRIVRTAGDLTGKGQGSRELLGRVYGLGADASLQVVSSHPAGDILSLIHI